MKYTDSPANQLSTRSVADEFHQNLCEVQERATKVLQLAREKLQGISFEYPENIKKETDRRTYPPYFEALDAPLTALRHDIEHLEEMLNNLAF